MVREFVPNPLAIVLPLVTQFVVTRLAFVAIKPSCPAGFVAWFLGCSNSSQPRKTIQNKLSTFAVGGDNK
jgi:hypothetical protein